MDIKYLKWSNSQRVHSDLQCSFFKIKGGSSQCHEVSNEAGWTRQPSWVWQDGWARPCARMCPRLFSLYLLRFLTLIHSNELPLPSFTIILGKSENNDRSQNLGSQFLFNLLSFHTTPQFLFKIEQFMVLWFILEKLISLLLRVHISKTYVMITMTWPIWSIYEIQITLSMIKMYISIFVFIITMLDNALWFH